MSGLVEGPVETSFSHPSAMGVGQSRSLVDGPDGWYALAAFGTAEPTRDLFAPPAVRDYQLMLYRHASADAPMSPTTSQELLRYEALEFASPTAIWAGDLDRDGELDLLVDATFHYNVSNWTLWLSSGADSGELVGEVATLTTTGC